MPWSSGSSFIVTPDRTRGYSRLSIKDYTCCWWVVSIMFHTFSTRRSRSLHQEVLSLAADSIYLQDFVDFNIMMSRFSHTNTSDHTRSGQIGAQPRPRQYTRGFHNFLAHACNIIPYNYFLAGQIIVPNSNQDSSMGVVHVIRVA
jgi:hypothetical protein